MNFKNQLDAVNELHKLAEGDRHSILIEGPSGCGKTYMSKLYSKLIPESSYTNVDPDVRSIKDTLDSCYSLDHNIILCIENLDTASLSSSYTMLKFLEEPRTNTYVIVTCRNISKIPDTIISRSAVVSVGHPTMLDIVDYANLKDQNKFSKLSKHPVWSAVRSFNDVDLVYQMKPEQLDYYATMDVVKIFNDTVSNVTWYLGHYSDNSETPLEFVIRYLSCKTNDKHIKLACNDCSNDLLNGRVAKHAVLAKFVFEGKYGE